MTALTVPNDKKTRARELAGNDPFMQDAWQRMEREEQGMQNVLAKHADVDAALFNTRPNLQYDSLIEAFGDYNANMNRLSKNGAQQVSHTLQQQMINTSITNTKPAYKKQFNAAMGQGDRAKNEAAMNYLLEETAPPSIVSQLTKQVYDKNKGGVQTGNIIGLAVGGTLGFLGANFMTGGFGGDWTSLLAGVALTGLGMYAGSKIAEMISPPTPAPPASGTVRTEAANTPGKTLGVEPAAVSPTPAASLTPKENKNLKVEHVDGAAPATPPPPTPSGKPPAPQATTQPGKPPSTQPANGR